MTKIIVLTGPESTAKSTLTKALATHYQAAYFPEYAREYLSGKEGNYTRADVEHIARKQVEQYEQALQGGTTLAFLDTWLIITKIWFEWVYVQVPGWLEEAIISHPVDLFLLCRPDIPWEPDPLREHGGEQRNQLFQTYRNELLGYGFRFSEIGGKGGERMTNAIGAIRSNVLL